MSLSGEYENAPSLCIHDDNADTCISCQNLLQRLNSQRIMVMPVLCDFSDREKCLRKNFRWRIVTGITDITMRLCLEHQTDLQQKNPHWKFYKAD